MYPHIPIDPNSPQIRMALKWCSTIHPAVRCLECGYIGSMGVEQVKKDKHPWYLQWWFILPFIFCPIGWILLGCRVVKGWFLTTTVTQTRCPACNALLTLIPTMR